LPSDSSPRCRCLDGSASLGRGSGRRTRAARGTRFARDRRRSRSPPRARHVCRRSRSEHRPRCSRPGGDDAGSLSEEILNSPETSSGKDRFLNAVAHVPTSSLTRFVTSLPASS
jgi:hypothetical protein